MVDRSARSATALLIIDMINDLEFEGGEQLLALAVPMAKVLAALRRRAKEAGIPVIYANDNFGRWRSDLNMLVEACVASGVRGREVVECLVPSQDDYFIIKPRHSAFYQTNLDTLLEVLGVGRVILTGMATDICVLFSANDAHMRGLHVVIPPDCVVAEDPRENENAIRLMARVLKADVVPSMQLAFNTSEDPRGLQSSPSANPYE